MSYAEVCGAVEALQKKYHENDPFRLCEDMNIQTVMTQCELWTDNNDMDGRVEAYASGGEQCKSATYEEKKDEE